MLGCTFPVVVVVKNQCNVNQRVTHIIKRYDRLLGKLDEGALLLGNGGESADVVRRETAVRPIIAH